MPYEEEDIEERLNRLFPGITKNKYTGRDVMPRGPRVMGQLAQRQVAKAYKGWSYDPTQGRNVQQDRGELLTKLNAMAQMKESMRQEETKTRAEATKRKAGEAAIRKGLAGIYGAPPGTFSGVPASELPAMYRTRAMLEEKAAAEEQEKARLRQMYESLIRTHPHLDRWLPTAEEFVQGGMDMAKSAISMAQEASRKSEEVAGKAALGATMDKVFGLVAEGKLGEAMQVALTETTPYMTGPQAIERAIGMVQDAQARVQQQQEQEQEAQEEYQRQEQKAYEGANKLSQGVLKSYLMPLREVAEPLDLEPEAAPPNETALQRATREDRAKEKAKPLIAEKAYKIRMLITSLRDHLASQVNPATRRPWVDPQVVVDAAEGAIKQTGNKFTLNALMDNQITGIEMNDALDDFAHLFSYMVMQEINQMVSHYASGRPAR